MCLIEKAFLKLEDLKGSLPHSRDEYNHPYLSLNNTLVDDP